MSATTHGPSPVSANPRAALYGFLAGLFAMLCGMLASFVVFRALLHSLSPELSGVWLLFLTLGGYVAFGELGLGTSYCRETSMLIAGPNVGAKDRATLINALFCSVSALALLQSFLAFSLGLGFGWIYLRSVVAASVLDWTTWLVYMLSAATTLFAQIWFAGVDGCGRVWQERLLQSSAQIIGSALMIVLLWKGFSLRGLAVASLAQSFLLLLFAWRAMRRLGLRAGRATASIKMMRQLLAPSLHIAAVNFGALIILQTDNIVIAAMLGVQKIADYQSVVRLIVALMAFSSVMSSTSTPFLTQAFASGDAEQLRTRLRYNLKFALGVMVIFGGILACFADDIIACWIGPGHFVGFSIVWVMLTMMVLETHHSCMASAVFATGRITFLAPALLAGALNLSISFALAPRLGLLGVALGTMLAQMMTNNWYAPWRAMSHLGIRVGDHMSRVVAPTLMLIACVLSLGALLRVILHSWGTMARLSLAIAVILAMGVATMWRVMLDAAERRALLNIARFHLSKARKISI